MNINKFNRVTHRDIGYLIAGMTLIYAISGIALNHKNDWNPNYIINNRSFRTDIPLSREDFDEDAARQILKSLPGSPDYKTFYYPSGNILTIFVDQGSVKINTATGEGTLESVSRRPLFFQINFLHYNPGRWWKYFSDIFCLSLMFVTVTGLFLVKGKNGSTRRGAVLVAIGVILPLLFLFIY